MCIENLRYCVCCVRACVCVSVCARWGETTECLITGRSKNTLLNTSQGKSSELVLGNSGIEVRPQKGGNFLALLRVHVRVFASGRFKLYLYIHVALSIARAA